MLLTANERRENHSFENLLRTHVLDSALDKGYAAMAADVDRESEAREWVSGFARCNS